MRRLSMFVLHATATGIMALGWTTFHVQTAHLVKAQKCSSSQFLTHHGLVFALSYMVVSLFCDIFPSVAVVRHLKKMLLMISMPLAFIISGIYWSFVLFFPDLIAHPIPELKPPLPIDLALHASPLVTLLIDFFVFEPRFSKTYVHWIAPVAAIVLPVWYASFVEYCASFNGSFPYPFLTHSPFAIRILIYATTAGITLRCFRMLNALHA